MERKKTKVLYQYQDRQVRDNVAQDIESDGKKEEDR